LVSPWIFFYGSDT